MKFVKVLAIVLVSLFLINISGINRKFNLATNRSVVAVPNIIGLEEEDALATLEDQQLEGSLVGKRFSKGIPANKVLEQRPEAGLVIKIGRRVGYVLSSGSEKVYLQDIK